MTDSVHSDWRLAQIEALESKIRELNDENIQLRKALEKYADPEHHFSFVDCKVWEVFDNSYGVDEQEFGTWARIERNG